jgi:hypothetical protein
MTPYSLVCINGSEKPAASNFRSLNLVINNAEECAASIFSSLKVGFEVMYCPKLQLPEGGVHRNVLPQTSAPCRWGLKEFTASISNSLNVGFKE